MRAFIQLVCGDLRTWTALGPWAGKAQRTNIETL